MNEQQFTEIQSGLRRLRGVSQAFLVKGNDKRLYVAKFAGNPKGVQSLVNEWLACRILEQLSVCTPSLRLLRLTPTVQQQNPFHFVCGSQKIAVEGETHLGSPLPCDPGKQAIWDFLPRTLLPHVENLKDFATTFVFDIWTQKQTPRQVVFFRSGESSFRASMIDHSSNFDFSKSGALSLPVVYFHEFLYDSLSMQHSCNQAAGEIQQLTNIEVYANGLPQAWLTASIVDELAVTFRELEQRKSTLHDKVDESLKLLFGPALGRSRTKNSLPQTL